MIINLMFHNEDGSREPHQWNTAEQLGPWEFVGTDTLDGGLSLTLRFSDVRDVDEFMVIAQAAYADDDLTDAQVVRWGRFMDSLAALIGAAPKFGETRVYKNPRAIAWDQSRSYHADIDARRDTLGMRPAAERRPDGRDGPLNLHAPLADIDARRDTQ